MSLQLVKQRFDLDKFPMLQFVNETSKILLMNEIQIVYWYIALSTYL